MRYVKIMLGAVLIVVVVPPALLLLYLTLFNWNFARDRERLYTESALAMFPGQNVEVDQVSEEGHPFERCVGVFVRQENGTADRKTVLVTLDFESSVLESRKIFASMDECDANVNRG